MRTISIIIISVIISACGSDPNSYIGSQVSTDDGAGCEICNQQPDDVGYVWDKNSVFYLDSMPQNSTYGICPSAYEISAEFVDDSSIVVTIYDGTWTMTGHIAGKDDQGRLLINNSTNSEESVSGHLSDDGTGVISIYYNDYPKPCGYIMYAQPWLTK